MNLYLSTLFAWAGLAVAIGVLVWALNGLHRLVVAGWHAWRTRRALDELWRDDKVAADAEPLVGLADIGGDTPAWQPSLCVGRTGQAGAPFDREQL